MRRRWSSRDSTNVTGGHTSSVHGPQLAGAPWRRGSCSPPPPSQSEPKPRSLPRLRPERSAPPRCLPSAPLVRNPGSELGNRPRAGTSRACPWPHLTRSKQRRGGSSEDPLCSATVPCHLLTLRGRSKSPDAPGAPRSAREEALYPVGTPPGTTWLECTQPPRERGCRSTLGSLPLFWKSPLPLSPPIHSPASGRSSRATRGRFAHVRALARSPPPRAPRLPPPPTSRCPQAGRRHLPRRPIPGTPTARGRARGTWGAHSLRSPRQRSRPAPRLPGTAELHSPKPRRLNRPGTRRAPSLPGPPPPPGFSHSPLTCLLRRGAAAAVARAEGPQHSLGGVTVRAPQRGEGGVPVP